MIFAGASRRTCVRTLRTRRKRNTKMGSAAPVKVGMVGYGRAAVQQHAPEMEAVKDKFAVVAVCVRNPARQAAAQAKYGCAIYGSYREFLGDPDVELVNISTPS